MKTHLNSALRFILERLTSVFLLLGVFLNFPNKLAYNSFFFKLVSFKIKATSEDKQSLMQSS